MNKSEFIKVLKECINFLSRKSHFTFSEMDVLFGFLEVVRGSNKEEWGKIVNHKRKR